jgi:hypothetical protein
MLVVGAWSCIELCSSHSRIAPASSKTPITQLRIVRVAGGLVPVISMDIDAGYSEQYGRRAANQRPLTFDTTFLVAGGGGFAIDNLGAFLGMF